MALEGRVAGIINARELTINIGKDENVELGMKFKVLASEPFIIRDPESGKKIGELDREKIRVKVSEVYDNFSVCQTYKVKNFGGIAPVISGSFIDSLYPPKMVVETLKIEDSELPPPLSEEESYVKSGDRVIQTDETGEL